MFEGTIAANCRTAAFVLAPLGRLQPGSFNTSFHIGNTSIDYAQVRSTACKAHVNACVSRNACEMSMQVVNVLQAPLAQFVLSSQSCTCTNATLHVGVEISGGNSLDTLLRISFGQDGIAEVM